MDEVIVTAAVVQAQRMKLFGEISGDRESGHMLRRSGRKVGHFVFEWPLVCVQQHLLDAVGVAVGGGSSGGVGGGRGRRGRGRGRGGRGFVF